MRRVHKGFTLIELMMVVLIVGILAAVAFPAYGRYVEQARRADGKSALLDAAQRLERCHTQTNTYMGCTFPAVSPDGHYRIETTERTAMEFTLTATRQGAQAGSPCGNYTLTSTGVRNVTNASLDRDRCW